MGLFIWMLISQRCKKWCGFIDYRKSEAIWQTDGQQTKFTFWGGLSDSASMMRWLHASLERWVSKMSMLCTPELDNRIANSSHFILYFQKIGRPPFSTSLGERGIPEGLPREAQELLLTITLDLIKTHLWKPQFTYRHTLAFQH